MSPLVEMGSEPIRSKNLNVPHFLVRLSDETPFDADLFDDLAERLNVEQHKEYVQLHFLVVSDLMYIFPNVRRDDDRFEAYSHNSVLEALQNDNLQAYGRILVNTSTKNRILSFDHETNPVNSNPKGRFAKMFGSFFTIGK